VLRFNADKEFNGISYSVLVLVLHLNMYKPQSGGRNEFFGGSVNAKYLVAFT
jgi:hypothetical protein